MPIAAQQGIHHTPLRNIRQRGVLLRAGGKHARRRAGVDISRENLTSNSLGNLCGDARVLSWKHPCPWLRRCKVKCREEFLVVD